MTSRKLSDWKIGSLGIFLRRLWDGKVAVLVDIENCYGVVRGEEMTNRTTCVGKLVNWQRSWFKNTKRLYTAVL